MPTIGHDGVEAGYGDVDALAELAARHPHAAPVGVFQVFNQAPFTIAVRADGPIRTATDLVGRRLIGKPDDAAIVVFPALAAAAGLDPASVSVTLSKLPMGEQVRNVLMQGQADGVFGFVNTIIAAAAPLGIAQVARSCGWPRAPKADELFTRTYLPPLQDRARPLPR